LTLSEKLIELYNAIEGTNYPKNTHIQINTLEDALFMNRINDISFIIDGKFVILIEHQSTLNQNMPLRFLLYIARVYEKIIDNKAIYKQGIIKVPTPEFIVLYNGNKNQPEEQTLKLSDAFISKNNLKIELFVNVININYGKSKILSKSKNLNGYSYFVYKTRQYKDSGLSLEQAIRSAINDCISQNILKEFLENNSSEVFNMLYTEFNINDAKEVWQEEAREEGIKEGIEKGRKEGEHNKAIKIAKSLIDVLDIKTIAQKTGLTTKEIENLKN